MLKQRFRILLLPLHYPLAFQSRIPVALCALQNFIQEIDQDEGAIPTDSYQSAYLTFMMTTVVSLQRMMMRQTQMLSYAGSILQMRCGKAT